MKLILTILLFLIPLCGYSQSKTENIFIITLDGYRWQELFTGADSLLVENKEFVDDTLALKSRFWANTPNERRKILMPFFWNTIATEGQLYGNRKFNNKVDCSNAMWFSYPGYHEILSGFPDDENINSNKKINNPNVTLLESLNRQAQFKGKVAAFGSWDVFPFIINEQRSGVPVNAGYEKATGEKLSEREMFLNTLQDEIPGPWGSVRLDAFTHYFALEHLRKKQPRVIYIAYGETDDFAHGGKYDEYLKSAHRTDQFIKDLWVWTQSQKNYKDKTTFLITTDHGRGTHPVETWRSHGDEIRGAGQIWFAVIGPDTPPTGEQKTSGQLYQNQVAKTAAAFLRVEYTTNKKVGAAISSALKK
ncbi:MAG: alkaline phosphatase family protein [Cyclobacteriaceae bacterium]